MAVPGAPFGGYTAPTVAGIPQAGINQILAQIDKLKALLPDPAASVSAPHSDFDLIHPETARKLRAEIDALKTAIDAAPST